jgi:alpha-glucosidase
MTDWWRGAVIYQVYPRSFMDKNGDGVGDLAGIIDRLDHIASLGVDVIWLSPITQSPQADMGYDVSDYKQIDRLFGTLEDFDTLIKRAHELGLKVIMDQVLSHTSDKHPWFQESRLSRTNARADWYVWADPNKDGTPPNNWASVFGGRAWEWNATRRQYYFHNFLIEQPDLNYHNPDVQDAALDIMRFWLERGLDGFRLDTANYYFHDQQLRSNPAAKRPKHLPYAVNPYDMQRHLFDKSQPENAIFLRRVRTLMDAFPGTFTVGEVGDSEVGMQLMADYTSGGDKLHMAYTFDMLGPEFTAKHFRDRLEGFFAAAPNGWPCWSFSNHDVVRHVTRWMPYAQSHEAIVRQSIAMLVSFKGSIGIYNGEELGLPEAELLYEELTDPPGIRFWPEYKGRDGCRTPIPWTSGAAPNGFSTTKPWLPVKPNQSVLNAEDQEANPDSTLHFYRKALAFRALHPMLKSAEMIFPKVAEPLLAFHRKGEDGAMLCLFNLSNAPLSVTLDGTDIAQPLDLQQAASLKGKKIVLGPNGFAFIPEAADALITPRFGGRKTAL